MSETFAIAVLIMVAAVIAVAEHQPILAVVLVLLAMGVAR